MILCTEHILFDYFEGIVSLIIALSTLIFAIIINNKISLKKSIFKKQLKTVSELINELQNLEFVIKTEDKISKLSTGKCIPFFQMAKKINETDITNYNNLEMFVTRNFYENLPFMSYSRNPLTPKTIADVIDKFYITFPYDINTEKYSSYMFINFRRIKGKTVKQKELIMNKDDEISKNFYSFYTICLELDSAIREWLKKFGVKELNLR